MRLNSLFRDLDHYSALLGDCGDDISVLHDWREFPSLLRPMAVTYRNVAKAYLATAKMIRRAATHLRPRQALPNARLVPAKQSLETLERLFISMRNRWDEECRRVTKLRKARDPRAHVVQTIVDSIEEEIRRTARETVQRAIKAGYWTRDWEKELGIRVWY